MTWNQVTLVLFLAGSVCLLVASIINAMRLWHG